MSMTTWKWMGLLVALMSFLGVVWGNWNSVQYIAGAVWNFELFHDYRLTFLGTFEFLGKLFFPLMQLGAGILGIGTALIVLTIPFVVLAVLGDIAKERNK